VVERSIHRHIPRHFSVGVAVDMYNALRDFDVVTCGGGCGGSGEAPGDGNNACRTCGGTGLEIRGGDPRAIRAALTRAEEE
jgi:hypothetical protein